MKLNKNFLLQSDNVSLIEKNAIMLLSMVDDSVVIKKSFLNELGSFNDMFYVPVGTVEFCKKWMDINCIPIPDLGYPSSLSKFFNRKIGIKNSYNEIENGFFVKPVEIKAWEAHVKIGDSDNFPGNVYFSEYKKFIAEWRVYIKNKEIEGFARYDDSEKEYEIDLDLIKNIIKNYDNQPVSYAIDLGLDEFGKFSIVEITDAWAIGLYKGMDPKKYGNFLLARWNEILQTSLINGASERSRTSTPYGGRV